MLTFGQLLRRLRVWGHKDSVEQEMNEELRLHLELETADGIRRGLSPEEAQRQARLSFGGVERFREEAREARGVSLAEEWLADFRYAFRVLRRAPVFTAVAALTLGLGIGANTAIFSVVNAVLLRQLPYRDPEQLVSVWDGGHSRAEFLGIQHDTRTLSSVAAYQSPVGLSLTGEGEPIRINSASVTASFFPTLGVSPALGRFFEDDANAPGAARVAVLSDAFWRDRYGADPSVVGRLIDLDGIPFQVVAVTPPGFAFPDRSIRAWIPLYINPQASGPHWGGYGHVIIGRLKPGVTRQQARDDVFRIAGDLRLANPVWRPGDYYLQNVQLSDLRGHLTTSIEKPLYVLFGAVGLVLLIACANVANLLILRGAARQRELAIRGTLGAGAGRLARQLLAEYGVLAAIGGAAAVVIAYGGTQLLLALLPADTPRIADVSLDPAALGFTALLTLATALIFGLAPARKLGRTEAFATMAGQRSGMGREHRRVAGLLVAGQIALGVVLAIGAGLLSRSLGRLLSVDPGFRTVSMVSARVSPPRAQTSDSRAAPVPPAAQRALVQQVLDRVKADPAVQDAAITNQLPFDASNFVMAMWIDGFTKDPNDLSLMEIRYVSPDFFRTMGIPLKRGRLLEPGDRDGTEPVVVVSETAARVFWNERDPVGGRVHYPWPGWLNVVGVVGDVKNNKLTEAAMPAMYVPWDQDPHGYFTVVARAAGDPAVALAAIRTAVRQVSRDIPVSDEQTMDELIQASMATPRSLGRLVLGFGGLALLLGCVGTYGLVAYGVERRSREIAVRLAVGAQRGDVLRMVLGEGARLAAAGLAVGIVAALALSRLLRGLLFEVTSTDPVAFTVAPAVLALTVMLACLVPALRATRVDPNSALRGE